jgi:heme exporter protein CcmD
MIEGGWSYIWAAYAATVVSLGGLALTVVLRLRFWAKQARALDAAKRK